MSVLRMFGVSLRQRRTNAPLSFSVRFVFGVLFAVRCSVCASITESFGRVVFGTVRCALLALFVPLAVAAQAGQEALPVR